MKHNVKTKYFDPYKFLGIQAFHYTSRTGELYNSGFWSGPSIGRYQISKSEELYKGSREKQN